MKTEPYIVGRRYLVPCVRGNWFGTLADWAVLGPRHEDIEYIGFEPQHYHLDARFIQERIWKEHSTYHGCSSAFNAPLHDYEGRTFVKMQPLGLRWRVCKRQWPEYPRKQAGWLKGLSDAYADANIGAAMICPHRGAPLGTLVPDESGCITCPLHGLRWRLETGKLVTP